MAMIPNLNCKYLPDCHQIIVQGLQSIYEKMLTVVLLGRDIQWSRKEERTQALLLSFLYVFIQIICIETVIAINNNKIFSHKISVMKIE